MLPEWASACLSINPAPIDILEDSAVMESPAQSQANSTWSINACSLFTYCHLYNHTGFMERIPSVRSLWETWKGWMRKWPHLHLGSLPTPLLRPHFHCLGELPSLSQLSNPNVKTVWFPRFTDIVFKLCHSNKTCQSNQDLLFPSVRWLYFYKVGLLFSFSMTVLNSSSWSAYSLNIKRGEGTCYIHLGHTSHLCIAIIVVTRLLTHEALYF